MQSWENLWFGAVIWNNCSKVLEACYSAQLLSFYLYLSLDAIGTVCHQFGLLCTDLLPCAAFNNLVLTNTLGPHKPSRRWTWHSPDGKHHNQIDYIFVKKHFRSGVNIHRTRSFPGADIGSDQTMTWWWWPFRFVWRWWESQTSQDWSLIRGTQM